MPDEGKKWEVRSSDGEQGHQRQEPKCVTEGKEGSTNKNEAETGKKWENGKKGKVECRSARQSKPCYAALKAELARVSFSVKTSGAMLPG